MSQTDSSCATSSKEKKPSVCDSVKNKISAKDSAENGAKCVNDNSSSSDKTQKERVLKEVGFTSTSFIGPAFPPETATVTVNTDIEDTLSEFYKELEEIDTPDDTNFNTEKQDAGVVRPSLQSKTPTSKEIQHTKQENTDNTSRPAETDAYQRRSGQKHASWPHWYQNEPYHHKRQRSGIDMHSGMATPPHSQQHYPLNRPPNPRFDRPPFHPPLPPSAFPNQQDPPLHTNHNWSSSGMTNQYRDQPPFPPFSTYKSGPPLPQDFLGDNSHHHDRAEKGYYDHDAHPDHFNAGRHRDKQEVLSQFGEDFDWRQRFHSKNELSERDPHCRPPDNSRSQDSVLVLILMRGLPGSGKSTMARYIFVVSINMLLN